MTQPKISLIIPIYNVAPWLPRCLESLQSQTLQDWEAILIDDLSTDSSGQIAQRFVEKDARFRLIRHEKNLGLGGSRNSGVAAAHGDYLFFLDSDDLLSKGTLEAMLKLAEETAADLVIGDFHEFSDEEGDPDTRIEHEARPIFVSTFTDKPDVFDWRRYRDDYSTLMASIFSTTCWGKLFRRKLWNKLGCKVPENLRMAEDFIPVKRFFFSAPTIAAYPRAALLYRKRAGSATTKRSQKAFEILKAYPHAMQMFKEVGVLEELSDEIDMFFLRTFRDHMLNLLPFASWWEFYRRSVPIVAKMAYTQQNLEIDGVSLAAWRSGKKLAFAQIAKFGLKQKLRKSKQNFRSYFLQLHHH